MNLYKILSTKSKNAHYLNRYIKFINYCSNLNHLSGEHHHICPKAIDMFPEYASFNDFHWNKAVLTIREHFIAHWLLYKTFHGSQGRAFHLMCNRTNSKNSKSYMICKQQQLDEFKKNNFERLHNGTHNFLTNNPSKKETNHRVGKKHSQETKDKISKTSKGKQPTTRGKTWKLSHIRIQPPYKIICCPYCNKSGADRIMKRWHFDKCKLNPN